MSRPFAARARLLLSSYENLAPAFASVTPNAGDEDAYAQLETDIDDQLARAATSAFSWPFLVAALLAALALVPIARLGTRSGGASWAIAAEPR